MVVKPIVKWAGGKRQLLATLIDSAPVEFERYYEPFVGGGALLAKFYSLGKVKKATISDINKDLINLYKVVKEDPNHLLTEINGIDFKSDKKYYYSMRDLFNTSHRGSFNPKRAALFLYLNKHSWNGLWRVNSNGIFNVPFGQNRSSSPPSRTNIMEFHYLLKNIRILAEDFQSAVRDAKDGDFVYFDPPYLPIPKANNFTDYTSHGFSMEDQNRLVETCRNLDRNGVKVMITNSDVPEIWRIFEGFDIRRVDANNMINSDSTKRKGAKAVIITNFGDHRHY